MPAGKTYPYHIDGFADPVVSPGQVYKVVGGDKVRFDMYYTTMRGTPVTIVLPGRSASEIYLVKSAMQFAGGGWKDAAWQNVLHAKKDYGWDALFSYSRYYAQ